MDEPLWLTAMYGHIRELCDRYEEGNVTAPGLLDQLRHPRNHLTPGITGGERITGGKPASKPTANINYIDLWQAIRWGALGWAWQAGWTGYNPDTALRTLPDITANLLDVDKRLARNIASWIAIQVSTARTALHYQDPSVPYPAVLCPQCDQPSIRCRIAELRAWCANGECPGDPETGGRYELSRIQLLQLLRTEEER